MMQRQAEPCYLPDSCPVQNNALVHTAAMPSENGHPHCNQGRVCLICLQVLEILEQNTTNPVVLSGDIHNAFVWRLFRDNATAPVRAASLSLELGRITGKNHC
jgi:phosphodiesterase/alkaline phosphatase D-like protein